MRPTRGTPGRDGKGLVDQRRHRPGQRGSQGHRALTGGWSHVSCRLQGSAFQPGWHKQRRAPARVPVLPQACLRHQLTGNAGQGPGWGGHDGPDIREIEIAPRRLHQLGWKGTGWSSVVGLGTPWDFIFARSPTSALTKAQRGRKSQGRYHQHQSAPRYDGGGSGMGGVTSWARYSLPATYFQDRTEGRPTTAPGGGAAGAQGTG